MNKFEKKRIEQARRETSLKTMYLLDILWRFFSLPIYIGCVVLS